VIDACSDALAGSLLLLCSAIGHKRFDDDFLLLRDSGEYNAGECPIGE